MGERFQITINQPEWRRQALEFFKTNIAIRRLDGLRYCVVGFDPGVDSDKVTLDPGVHGNKQVTDVQW